MFQIPYHCKYTVYLDIIFFEGLPNDTMPMPIHKMRITFKVKIVRPHVLMERNLRGKELSLFLTRQLVN